MKHNLNAFTLIEMLIVICIITIILWFTMNFSWDRIQLLNNKNTQEEFMTAYDEQYLIVSNSNYIDWQAYNQLEINFEKDDSKFSYDFIWSNWSIKSGNNDILWKIKIKEICLKSESIQKLTIILKPYQLWCTLNDSGWTAIIKIWVNDDREDKCFQISSQLWRLISMKKCPTSCTNFTVSTDDMTNIEYEQP